MAQVNSDELIQKVMKSVEGEMRRLQEIAWRDGYVAADNGRDMDDNPYLGEKKEVYDEGASAKPPWPDPPPGTVHPWGGH